MTVPKSLEEKLASSEAFRTLTAERAAVEAMSRWGWDARHSPFYKDPMTGKPRELDAIARRVWLRADSKSRIAARVNLLVEVKSAREFHVLCTSLENATRRFEANEYWIGYCEETLGRLAAAAGEFGLKPPEIRDFMRGVEKVCFPNHTMRSAAYRIDAMPVAESFSAFRETNTSTDKDLDNSVLWRAVSALRSAVSSAKRASIESVVDDARVDMEVARRRNKSLLWHTASIEDRASTIDFYVPVVVIDSRLWSAEDARPTELTWFRLVENNLGGGAENWTDVVNSKHFEAYLAATSAYFEDAFEKLGGSEFQA